MADTAIVTAGKAPIRAVEETFDNPVATAAMSGLNSVLRSCKKCKVTTVQTITPGQWSTKVAPTTAAAVNATPNVNYVFPIVDSMAIYATSGVSSANKAATVKVVSSDGSGSGPLSLVKSGGPFIADPGFSDTWVGWLALDQAMRAMSGMKPGNPVVPVRYLAKSNLKKISNLNSQATLFGSAYVKGFERLWGVK
jgi:ribose transport system substrate-binding protein